MVGERWPVGEGSNEDWGIEGEIITWSSDMAWTCDILEEWWSLRVQDGTEIKRGRGVEYGVSSLDVV